MVVQHGSRWRFHQSCAGRILHNSSGIVLDKLLQVLLYQTVSKAPGSTVWLVAGSIQVKCPSTALKELRVFGVLFSTVCSWRRKSRMTKSLRIQGKRGPIGCQAFIKLIALIGGHERHDQGAALAALHELFQQAGRTLGTTPSTGYNSEGAVQNHDTGKGH